ncbi:MAG: peptidoglycan-binding domain-containing protein [Pseudomonadota bacterium]
MPILVCLILLAFATPAQAVLAPRVEAPAFATPAANVEEMTPEMARAFVVGIQEELAKAGYSPGPADGILGDRTRAAIRAYQRNAGLPVDGQASSELLDHMKFVTPKVTRPAAPPLPIALVLDVQEELARRGYLTDQQIDGLDGPRTRAAVRRFQNDAGLPITGTVDQRLLDDLRGAPSEVVAR